MISVVTGHVIPKSAFAAKNEHNFIFGKARSTSQYKQMQNTTTKERSRSFETKKIIIRTQNRNFFTHTGL